MINDTPGKDIVLKRGLRQGDPLFPLPFILVADGLNSILQKLKAKEEIEGFPRAPNFVNLQYADDTLIFG